MLCPRCRHDNEARAKFCEECAAPLSRTCTSCGGQLSSTAKFCPECAQPVGVRAITQPRFGSVETYTPKHLAEKILTSRSALEGERKQVTVLFADLKGSMELLSDRDPEEARKILDPVLERMMEAVHRYEGTVNQVMGDGIMALFGAPVAHEDHAVRACYAALRMQESMKKYTEEVRRAHAAVVKIRVGMNSGEVVVRAIGNDLHMDYTAVGQTTHLAARMEQLADPGTIVITSSTLVPVEGYVEVKSLGPMQVKGLAGPLEAYEVTGPGSARSRLQATARHGLTRFVGRDAELEQLRRLQQLARNDHGQIAAIVGEAGVGKSRLVYEFNHSHRLEGWRVLESISVSYGKSMSYLPVIDLLKNYFSIHQRDHPREIREKVTGKLLTLDEALKPTLPALLALLDVPVDASSWQALNPAQRRQRTLDAVRRLLLREAREQPILIIFEDLQWIDGETQAFLDALVESLSSTRILLFLTYRPEYHHAWGNKTYYTQMRLDALPVENVEQLLDALLGDEPGLAPLKHLLVKRANPFFLEETVRTLFETKALAGERGRYRLMQEVKTIQVPATVQAMLTARIDRLPVEDKRLLQISSVVGMDVPLTLLQRIAELPEERLRQVLVNLQAAEFLLETGLYPDLEYTFKHSLTHEVTYGSLLQERRRVLHARIVDAIETIHDDRLGGEIERLAHHAVRGGLPDKAVHYLRQAGAKAVGRYALQDARAWLEEALVILAAQPESPTTLEPCFEIRLDLRAVLSQLGEVRRTLEHLREAEALAERLSDSRRRGEVCAFLTNTYSLLGELDEARASADRALTSARHLGDIELRVLATTYLEQVQYFRGHYQQVVDLACDNLAALPRGRDSKKVGRLAPTWVDDRYWLVLSLAQLGRFTEAAEHDADAARLAEQNQQPYTVVQCLRASAMLQILKGSWAKARLSIEQAVAVVRPVVLGFFLSDAIVTSAWVLAQLGEIHEALKRILEGEQMLEGQAARGLIGRLGYGYHALGRACLLLGRVDEARRFANRAVELSPRQSGFSADALLLLGDLESQTDGFAPDAGEARYNEALALAEQCGMRPLIAHCHLGLGNLHFRTANRATAHEHFATATGMYSEMHMVFWLEKAEAQMRLVAQDGKTSAIRC
jgi:class 3 adenylate cyclase/tetratricopeptide (TPR) repeat protein